MLIRRAGLATPLPRAVAGCACYHTRLPSAAALARQRQDVARVRRADAVRAESDATRRKALGHSRHLRECLERGASGVAEAWGRLRLLVETGEVNEYHFSLVLRDGCADAEAVLRLSEMMAEAGTEPNHVLVTGLHGAWLRHAEFQRAVGVLAEARDSGSLTGAAAGRVATAALAQLAGGSDAAAAVPSPRDVTAVRTPWDYLRELSTAGLAEPQHFALALRRLCHSADSIHLLLNEVTLLRIERDIGFLSALHDSWLRLGDVSGAVSALEDARALSTTPRAEELLSRLRSDSLRTMMTDDAPTGPQRGREYFSALQACGLADIFQYAVMAESCEDRDELVELFDRKALLPHAATYTTLHHVWVRLGEMEDAIAQLQAGVEQEVLTESAASNIINATVNALTHRRTSGARLDAGRRGNKGGAYQPCESWGWRVRPASAGLDDQEESESGVVAEESSQRQRAWEYFRAAQRGSERVAGLLGRAQHKRMLPHCSTAGELRRLIEEAQAAEAQLQPDEPPEPAQGEGDSRAAAAAVRQQWRRPLACDFGFAEAVHRAWLRLGDPAAAVETLAALLEADAAASQSDEPRGRAREKSSRSVRLSLQDRVGRCASNTLLQLTTERDGAAAAAAEAAHYLQILRRCGLADVFHYTIVLQSCDEKAQVERLLLQMRDDGVRHTSATKRTLAHLRARQLLE